MANAQNLKNRYECPVCGFDELRDAPEAWSICPCCGTEFEADNFERSYRQLRMDWVNNGLPWFSKATRQPKDWSPYRQLIEANESYALDLIVSPRMDTDVEYRYAVDAALSDFRMARQLKAEREGIKVPLTQAQLAEKAEMKQSRISELERIDYSSWSVSTLRRLAKALGVRFVFGFETWGRLRQQVAQGFSPSALYVPTFEQEPALERKIEITVRPAVTPAIGINSLLFASVQEPEEPNAFETLNQALRPRSAVYGQVGAVSQSARLLSGSRPMEYLIRRSQQLEEAGLTLDAETAKGY
jgi:transcriptional regulator with XRE-family HTH domain